MWHSFLRYPPRGVTTRRPRQGVTDKVDYEAKLKKREVPGVTTDWSCDVRHNRLFGLVYLARKVYRYCYKEEGKGPEPDWEETNMARIDTTMNHLTVMHHADGTMYRQADATEVKAWGEDNGYTVNHGRGRMPVALKQAFNAAHGTGKRRAQYVDGNKSASVTKTFTTANKRKAKVTGTLPVVRKWAKENGYTVGDRGRLSEDVWEAFGRASRV